MHKEGKTEDKKETKEPEEQDETEKKEFSGKVFNQVPGNYHKKVNFKAIENKLNDYDQSVKDATAPVIKKIFADLYDQIEKKKIIAGGHLDRIDSIKIKYLVELRNVFKNSSRELYVDGQNQASSELFKSNFKTVTADDKFLEMLDQDIYDYIGKYEFTIKDKVKRELKSAITDGRPLSSVIGILDDEGKKLSDASIQRFARTKHTEVLNKARVNFFNDSGVVAGYQYNAILDDQTSAICRGLHGKTFKAGQEPIPPLHFNCRSVLVPITKFEEFSPSETVGKVSISEFIEENKGEGFATK